MTRNSFYENDESGVIQFANGMLAYHSDIHPSWSLRADDLTFIAEVTTDQGPFVDDFFVVFGTKDGNVLWASFYARGRDAALSALEAFLKFEFTFQLVSSASNASNVIWPEQLRGLTLDDVMNQDGSH